MVGEQSEDYDEILFSFQCSGNKTSKSELLVLWGNGTVHKPIGEVCTKEDRGVRVASNNDPGSFEVANDATVEGAWGHTMVEIGYEEVAGFMSWQWEIEKSFFNNFHLSPTFYDNTANYRGVLEMVRQFLALFLPLCYSARYKEMKPIMLYLVSGHAH